MTNPNDPASILQVSGLTKREWFAGMAMMGILANSDIAQGLAKVSKSNYDLSCALMAEMAFVSANAMIERLNKDNKI